MKPRTTEQKKAHAEYMRRWYAANPEKSWARKHPKQAAENAKKRRRANADILYIMKRLAGCAVCGITDPAVLIFHHTGDKRAEVSLLNKQGCSLTTVLEETRKCVVLCCNCHAKQHEGNHDERDQ